MIHVSSTGNVIFKGDPVQIAHDFIILNNEIKDRGYDKIIIPMIIEEMKSRCRCEKKKIGMFTN